MRASRTSWRRPGWCRTCPTSPPTPWSCPDPSGGGGGLAAAGSRAAAGSETTAAGGWSRAVTASVAERGGGGRPRGGAGRTASTGLRAEQSLQPGRTRRLPESGARPDRPCRWGSPARGRRRSSRRGRGGEGPRPAPSADTVPPQTEGPARESGEEDRRGLAPAGGGRGVWCLSLDGLRGPSAAFRGSGAMAHNGA